MQLHPRVTLSLAMAAALSLVACGKKEIDPERRAQAQAAKAKDGDWNANRVRLKSLTQTQPNSSEARLQLGIQLLADGEPAAAMAEFNRALELKHAEAQVLPYLAQAMNQSGKGADVILQFGGKQLADPPSTANLMAELALAQEQQGNPLAARKTIQDALVIAPKAPRVLLALTRLQIAHGELKPAMASIETLLETNPKDHEAWAIKGDLLAGSKDSYAQALEAYDKATAIKADFLYPLSAGLSLRLTHGELDAAKKDFARLQKAAPKHVNTGMAEASIAFATGDYNKARDIYQALLRALPEDFNLLLAAGENEMRRNAPQQAEALFAKASALLPRDARARRLLAESQLKLGQPARALVTLSPLVEVPEASAEALALAAEASLLNGETRAADALFKRLDKLKPSDPQLRTLVARAKLNKSNDEAAYGELREIAAKDTGTTADLALVTAYLQRNQFDQALAAVNALIAKRPTDPSGHGLRGKILMGKGDKAGARAAFEAALALNRSFHPAVASLALLDLQENKPDDARKRFTDVLKLQPKNVQAMLGLAELKTRLGAPRAEVMALLETAVKEMPNDIEARIALISNQMAANNHEAALSAAQSATAVVPDNLDLLDLLGKNQIRNKQVTQALATFGRMITLQPKSHRGHLGMVDAYLEGDQLDLAQQSLNRALDIAPHQMDVLGHGVAIAVRKRQYPAALDYARRIQADRPGESMGFLLEGEIELSRGDWDNAAAALRKGMERPLPGGAAAKLHHALVSGGKAAEAEKTSKEWLKTHPNDTSLLFYLGTQAQDKGDLPAAEGRYEQVLSFNPSHALALNNLAMIKVKQQKPGAVDLAKRAIEAMPDQPPLLDTLAQAHAADKAFDKAIEVQQRATVLAPNAAIYRLGLARYQLAAGNKALAKAELTKLAALGSSFEGHQEVAKMMESLGSVLPGR